ncbi:UDP-forming cellulose synthase catalytic subunit [Amorphus orientalis]|uniref:Cellulose synthase catalytic subunit [UDP-forming] n=1 Tax=Amorphus orientalis TaxID=649198 RepID=A0AAE3VR52_9HYPH|nr:UDP-forming cellulose synthase catalytic subunit [Amorphus orientalis]MDQ0317214.1 cellulose synthase (UDP-forming) [Amorphus orientalis]
MRRILIVVAWAVAALVVIFLVTQPVDINTHFITAMLVAALIAIFKNFKREGALRLIVLALGTAIVLRYVYWRTTSTIPPVAQLEDFIPGIILYVAEMYSVFMLCLSLFAVADPLDRPKAPVLPDEDQPTIDVFVPTYNEEPELLATTLAAALQMDYPKEKFIVYLLDDGGTDQKCEDDDPEKAAEAQARRRELQQLARDLGARYLTRAKNLHAKAGNLNNGLAHSHGELIVVFDADHAPARDFLKQTVGLFRQDKKLFLVQTPHFFINPDPLERNLETWDRMPSENEMFYGMIQRGFDKWDGSFFCGSAAVLRRAALEEAGGFSGVSITEDAESALELHSRGWHSAYVDRPMIAGLQPETFASFIGQRSRWAQGMLQIILLKRPFLKSGLKIQQRLCYLAASMFWIFPFARLTFLFAPLAYLFFSLQIFNASGAEFAAYTMTYMLINILLQNYLYSNVRWPFISELYETIQSVYLIRALGGVLLNPTKPTFKVTAKGEATTKSRISELGWPFYIIFFILVFALLVTIWRVWTQPYISDIAIVVGGWNVFNLIIMGAALGVVSERRNLRQSQRVTIERKAEILVGDEVVPAKIDDVSVTGTRILVPSNALRNLKRGQEVNMRFETRSQLASNTLPLKVMSIMRDEGGQALGCRFVTEEPLHFRLVADLVFADSDEWVRFQQSRRKDIGVLRGIIEFFVMAFYQTVRGLSYLFPRKEEAPQSQPFGTDNASTTNHGPQERLPAPDRPTDPYADANGTPPDSPGPRDGRAVPAE